MMFSKKPKGTFQEDNTDEKLQLSLNKLDWIYCENTQSQKAWEMFKKRNIKNYDLLMRLNNMPRRFKLSKFVYTNLNNRIERTHPKLVCKSKRNLLYHISKPFKVMADLSKKEGIVTDVS